MAATTPTSTTTPRARRLVLRLYFLSSAATLAMELVWIRMLSIACGGTVYSVAAVLGVYMLASACGAVAAGRLLRRNDGLRLFGFCSLLASAAFLASVIACLAAPGLFAVLAGGGPVRALLSRVFLAALVCAPGSFFAGAMYPALGSCIGGGRAFGTLHLFGCAGSAGGAAVAGLVGFASLGVGGTALAAAGCDAAVGLAAIKLSRGGRDAAKGETAAAFCFHPVLIATFAAGAAMMASEVAFTRALGAVLGSSVYSTTIVLGVFLAGLGGGGFLAARAGSPRRTLAWALLVSGVSIPAAAAAVGFLPRALFSAFRLCGESFAGILWAELALAAAVLFFPACLLGAVLPSSARAIENEAGTAAAGAASSASHLVGGLIGALAASVAGIPLLGARATLLASGLVCGAAGAALSWRKKRALLALCALAAIFLPQWDLRAIDSGVASRGHRIARFDSLKDYLAEIEILFYEEGANANVSVTRQKDVLSMQLDGKTDASTGLDMLTQLFVAHLPLLLQERPQRVCMVGLGSGVSAGAALRHDGVERLDVVEIERAVARASLFFSAHNGVFLSPELAPVDPRARLFIEDARTFLRRRGGEYDVIVSQPSNPWVEGEASLFSVEFFRSCRERLAEGGVMAQWVQGYSLGPEELRTVAAGFVEAFGEASMWCAHKGEFVLLSGGFRRAGAGELAARVAGLGEAGEALELRRPEDMASCLVLPEEDLLAFARGGAPQRDWRPVLEYTSPLALYRETIDANISELARHRKGGAVEWLGVAADEEAVERLRGLLARRGLGPLSRYLSLDFPTGRGDT